MNNNGINNTLNSKMAHEVNNNNNNNQMYSNQQQQGPDGNNASVYQMNSGLYLNVPYPPSPYR